MKIFLERGRLGNQLLQYYGISNSLMAKELTVVIGMNELRSFLSRPNLSENHNFYFLPIPSTQNFLRLIHLLFAGLVKIKILQTITEDDNGKLINYHNGSVYQNCYFQQKDTPFLNNRNYVLKNIKPRKNTYFLHVRRGDYAYWPSIRRNALLPRQYYKDGMQKIVAVDPSAKFLVFSDDMSWARNTFAGCSRCYVEDTNIEDAILLMCSCVGGILSPSSISLFAAHQIWSREIGRDPLLIAPHFWAGFKAAKWMPNSQFDWLKYMKVDYGD